MFRIFSFALIAILTTTIHAKTKAQYPMTIRCVDPTDSAGAKIEIGFNLFENEAYLNYIPNDLSSATVVIAVGQSQGFYSSSSVSMENSFNQGLYDRERIVISAFANRAMRTLDYAQFSLTLTKKNDGTLLLKELNYGKGNDAYTTGNIGATLGNLPLTCTMSY